MENYDNDQTLKLNKRTNKFNDNTENNMSKYIITTNSIKNISINNQTNTYIPSCNDLSQL